ncbi:unnamed protein product [Caretta caretta]
MASRGPLLMSLPHCSPTLLRHWQAAERSFTDLRGVPPGMELAPASRKASFPAERRDSSSRWDPEELCAQQLWEPSHEPVRGRIRAPRRSLVNTINMSVLSGSRHTHHTPEGSNMQMQPPLHNHQTKGCQH